MDIANLRDFNSGPFVFRSDVLAVDPLMESINSSAGVDSFRLGPSLLSAAWSHITNIKCIFVDALLVME